MLTNRQCRMARAALDWTITDLVRVSGVNATSISKFEQGATRLIRANEQMIVQAFTNAGLVLKDERDMRAVMYPTSLDAS